MDAIKYLKEKERMCYKQEDCTHCPLKTDDDNTCSILEETNPEEAVEIVEEWSKEHPQKTILLDFLERYPNATLSSKGVPICCALHLGYLDKCEAICSDCWNRPLVEEV